MSSLFACAGFPCSSELLASLSCILIPRLCNPEPDLLQHISWVLLWPYLSIKRCLAGPNVCFRSLHELSSLPVDRLPEEPERDVDESGDVSVLKSVTAHILVIRQALTL